MLQLACCKYLLQQHTTPKKKWVWNSKAEATAAFQVPPGLGLEYHPTPLCFQLSFAAFCSLPKGGKCECLNAQEKPPKVTPAMLQPEKMLFSQCYGC